LLGFISTIVIGLPFGAFSQIVKAYSSQTAGSATMTNNAPSFWALFFADKYKYALSKRIAIIFTLVILFGMLLLIIIQKARSKNIDWKESKLKYISLFFFSALIVPFFLPNMRERYFYLAEIAALMYVIIFPKRWYVSLLIILPSCATYFNYLFKSTTPLWPGGLAMFAAVIFVVKWTIESVFDSPKIQNKNE
jgi:uncharacterized membrane protein